MSESSSHLPIEQSRVYRLFADLSDQLWDEVQAWKTVAQNTVGEQLIRAIDSVGANLVEGDGRYSVADAIHFFVMARASAREAAYWVRRAKKRSLISVARAADYLERLDHATRALNNLITYRRQRGPLQAKESRATYNSSGCEHQTPNPEHPEFNPEHPTPNTEHQKFSYDEICFTSTDALL
jgi:four helix bundle protein